MRSSNHGRGAGQVGGTSVRSRTATNGVAADSADPKLTLAGRSCDSRWL